jgi:hypothetical protein
VGRAVASSRSESFEEFAWGEDGDVVGCKVEEVGVAEDQQVGLAVPVEGDELFVLGVIGSWWYFVRVDPRLCFVCEKIDEACGFLGR